MHLLLFLHVGRYQVVQEEECLGVHGDKYVVLKVSDAAANHLWTFFVVLRRRSLALNVVSFQVHPETWKLEDLLIYELSPPWLHLAFNQALIVR